MKKTDMILKYLSNEMSEEEKQYFIKEIERDKELSGEYELILKIWENARNKLSVKEALDSDDKEELMAAVLAAQDVDFYKKRKTGAREKEFRKQLQDIMDQNSGNQKGSKKNLYNLTVILISTAAAIAFLFILFINTQNVQELALNFYNPTSDQELARNMVIPRSAQSEGLLFFNAGRFGAAQYSFEQNYKPTDYPKIDLMLGICYFENNQPQKSVETLEKIFHNETGSIKLIAGWYLSLICIQEGDPEDAVSYLETLEGSDGKYKNKASRLLKKID